MCHVRFYIWTHHFTYNPPINQRGARLIWTNILKEKKLMKLEYNSIKSINAFLKPMNYCNRMSHEMEITKKFNIRHLI